MTAVHTEQTDATAQGEAASQAIVVEDLTVFRGPLPAVRNVTFTVTESESIGILGRNGAGKSTLLGGLVGILPTRGAVHLRGRDISNVPAWKRARSGMAL